jgi:hypothetical protein
MSDYGVWLPSDWSENIWFNENGSIICLIEGNTVYEIEFEEDELLYESFRENKNLHNKRFLKEIEEFNAKVRNQKNPWDDENRDDESSVLSMRYEVLEKHLFEAKERIKYLEDILDNLAE